MKRNKKKNKLKHIRATKGGKYSIREERKNKTAEDKVEKIYERQNLWTRSNKSY